MMRKTLSVALVAVASLVLASSASALITVDLIWQDSGTSVLTITPGEAQVANACQGARLSGGQSPGPASGRCLRIQWTFAGAQFLGGADRVGWSAASGLSGTYAAFGPFAIPVGKGFAQNVVSGVSGNTAAIFGAASLSDTTLAMGGVTGANAGTVVFDTSGSTTVGTFLLFDARTGGVDEWLFNTTDGSTAFPVPTSLIQFNGATLNVVPEPGTASLLGLGLIGLMVASRRRNA